VALRSSIGKTRHYAHREASWQTLLLNLMHAYAFNRRTGNITRTKPLTLNFEVPVRLAVATLSPYEWTRVKERSERGILMKMGDPRVII
jgi:hypothetical protein